MKSSLSSETKTRTKLQVMQKPHTDAALGLGTTDSGKLPGKRATRIRALGLTGPTSLFEYFFFFKAKQRWVCHKKYARSAEVSSFKGRTISPSWLKRKWCFVFTTEWNAASVSPEFLCSEDLSFGPLGGGLGPCLPWAPGPQHGVWSVSQTAQFSPVLSLNDQPWGQGWGWQGL